MELVTSTRRQDGRDAIAIVAHPDDEILWCGGLILQKSDWSWSILSLSRAGDEDRCPKFRRVCEHLGAQGWISDLDDSNPLRQLQPVRDIGRRISQYAGGRDWDLCITHGANGEYGHQRHREVHAEVMRLAGGGGLSCRELWTFACVCDARTGQCTARSDSDIRVALTDGQLAEKKRIVHEMYGYGPDSFEVKACVSPEGFHRQVIRRREDEKGV